MRAMEGGVVGSARQADEFAPVGRVAQVLLDAAVVGAEEGHEGEAGEELGLGEDLGAEAVGVIRQSLPADRQSDQDHLPW